MIGESRSFAPRRIKLGPEGLAFLPLEVLIVRDQHDAVTRGDPEHRQEADQRTEGKDAVVEEVDSKHTADQRGRQGQEREGRQAPAAEGGEEDEEDADKGEDPHLRELTLRRTFAPGPLRALRRGIRPGTLLPPALFNSSTTSLRLRPSMLAST